MEQQQIQEVKQIQQLNIQQHSTIVVTSKRVAGKSVLVQNLCYKLIQDFNYQNIIMFSSTGHLEDEWNFMSAIYNDDDLDDKLSKLFEYQEKNIKKKQAILLVLDDVNMLNNNRSKILTKVFSLGRHLFLTIIVSVQYPKYILNGLIRNKIDYLFFSELNQVTLKSVYEMIFINQNFKDFEQFVNQNNHDFQYIFYNNKEKDKNKRLEVVKAQMMQLEQKGKKKQIKL